NNVSGVRNESSLAARKSILNIPEAEEDNTLIWNREFMIGVELIDREHKEIITRYSELYLAMKSGSGHENYNELLAFLSNYVHNHFMHEESLQQEIQYEHFEEHKALHREFTSKVDNLISSRKDTPVSSSDLIMINLIIKDWLLHHILIEDQRIGNFISANKLRQDQNQAVKPRQDSLSG
ncbi:MAG: hemerythrin family protein, partial [Clostridiales bacterium]|nr:hemerythrin family protein [Clostridiales bacterium]